MSGIDHCGTDYIRVLQAFHDWLKPASYLEIGTLEGLTLGLATCPSIAVDPQFRITDAARITNKPQCHLVQCTSDIFFDRFDPAILLRNQIDLAFLDGMHHCEFLLRDFMNTERFCRPDSIIVMHDCLPVEVPMAERDRARAVNQQPNHHGWWTGDVWRTAVALKYFRPDLAIRAFDAPPTGLVVVSRLDPESEALRQNYTAIVQQMLSWQLAPLELFQTLRVEPTSAIGTAERMLEAYQFAPRL